MKYEGTVYRPPSEANSFILQATIGCAHNKCTFCGMYKDKVFRVRSQEAIHADLEGIQKVYPSIKRFFLADGNALVLKTQSLIALLQKIKSLFPMCERVSLYASPMDILRKSLEELVQLREQGLGIVYMGIETGSDTILKTIQKGSNSDEMVAAGKRVVASGLTLSTMIISGLGGRRDSEHHAVESARVLSAIDPHYISLLTLMVEEGTPLKAAVLDGQMELLSAREVLAETQLFLEKLQVSHAVFRSNHASNYVSLKGDLPRDQKRLLDQLREAQKLSDADLNRVYRQL